VFVISHLGYANQSTCCPNPPLPPTVRNVPCPNNCCGAGTCNSLNGVCNCSFTPAPADCCATPAPIAPVAAPVPTAAPTAPPCFNAGQFCCGNGLCVNGSCQCNAGFQDVDCCGVIPPPTSEPVVPPWYVV
jgi:hypothetical protein